MTTQARPPGGTGSEIDTTAGTALTNGARADSVNGARAGSRLGGARANGNASTGELVSRAAEQLSTLVRDEIALAKAELMRKGKRAGMGAGMFGGAGLMAWYGVGLGLIAAVLALDLVWPAWLAALVVMAVVFLIAGVLALVGRTQIKRATPPIPQDAAASIAADVEKIKAAFQDGRRS